MNGGVNEIEGFGWVLQSYLHNSTDMTGKNRRVGDGGGQGGIGFRKLYLV